MIKFLQSGNRAAKYLLGGLMLIMIASMCLYLIPGFMSGGALNQSGVVASVGGQDITTQQVQQLVSLIQEQQRQRGQVFPDALRGYLARQAIQQLLQEAEIRYEGDRLGLNVSDKELQDTLRNGQFKEMFYPKGSFIGFDRYQELVRANYNLTTDEFERELRTDLLRTKLVTAITAGISASPAEIEKSYKEQNTKVKFDYAVLKMDDLEKTINPTDAELKSFYDTNKARYQNSIPEKRQVRYFVISEKDAEAKVNITAQDIAQYYAQNQEKYRNQDRVKVRHILIETPKAGPDGKIDQKGVDAARAKAADILKQVRAGGDFAELANKYSDDPGNKGPEGKEHLGGELGWIEKGRTVPEFEKAAFSQNKGQISDLVQSSYGFHIIQTEDKEVASVKPLADVKGTIEQALKQQRVAALLENLENQAQADAKNLGMDKAAAKYSAQLIETNPIARTDSLAGIGVAPQLMNTIFTVDPKDGVQSNRTPQGDVVFQVTKIIPPQTPEFEEIKDRVTNDFKSERANTLLSQKTAELSDRAHAGHDLAKAAKELGATVKTSELVNHTAQVPDIGSMSSSAGAAFNLKQGEISGPLTSGRNGFVLQLTEREEPPLSGDEFTKAQDNIRDEILGRKRQEAMELFINSLGERLRKEGKLKINDKELEAFAKGIS